MTYHEMLDFFAEVARHDGGLTVWIASNEPDLDERGGDLSWEWATNRGGAERPWEVELRDNARPPFPDAGGIHAIYHIVDLAQLALLGHGLPIARLWSLMPQGFDPGFQLTWSDARHVLDRVAERRPRLFVGAIQGTMEPDPRYRVAVWTDDGMRRHLIPSLSAFERFWADEG